MSFSFRTPMGIVLLALCVIAFTYLLLPIVVIVVAPFGDTGYLAFPPQGFTLRWYEAALDDSRYLPAFFLSLRLGVGVALVSAAIGLLAAYALARYRFPGRGLLEAFFLSPLILPTLVLAVALTLFFTRSGAPTGSWRLFCGHILICTPYVIRIVLPLLRRFDISLEEAAQSLGANRLLAFFLVLLPVIRPGLAASTIIAFITSFDDVVLALFLAVPGKSTLPVEIYSAVQLGFEPTVAAVAGLLVGLTAILMLLYHLASPHRSE